MRISGLVLRDSLKGFLVVLCIGVIRVKLQVVFGVSSEGFVRYKLTSP